MSNSLHLTGKQICSLNICFCNLEAGGVIFQSFAGTWKRTGLPSATVAGRMEPRYIYFIWIHWNRVPVAVLKKLQAWAPAMAGGHQRTGQLAARQWEGCMGPSPEQSWQVVPGTGTCRLQSGIKICAISQSRAQQDQKRSRCYCGTLWRQASLRCCPHPNFHSSLL